MTIIRKTEDAETIVALLNELISRTNLPDPIGRTRAAVDLQTIALNALLVGQGVSGSGSLRVVVASDSIPFSQTLPVLYNNIVITA
jgi:hypothetical protein